MKSILAWHFLPDSARTRYSDEPVTVGSTLHATGPLRLCENGLHASVHPLDALRYAPGFLLCRVKLSNEVVTGSDKLCARSRKVLQMHDVRTEVLTFAADCAERALGRVKKPDPRSLAAVAAIRAHLRGEPVDLGRVRDATYAAAYAATDAAASDAAAYAAYDAASASDAAAYDAASASDAAYDAAYAARAASDAAYDASDAARADEVKWQRSRLSALIAPKFL